MEGNLADFSFIDDPESVEACSFNVFLAKLESNFIPASDQAEEDLKNFVAGICQHSYQVTEELYDIGCALWAQFPTPTIRQDYPAPRPPLPKPQNYPF